MIGVFDSGVGGLSVWREIARQLPGLDILYIADQAHVPYGSRPLEQVRAFTEEVTRFLLQEEAEVIVLACNTVSAAALQHLRNIFPDTPFVGMEPAVKPAARNTSTGIVGVIATPATFQGQLFASLLERFATDVRVCTQICPGLVEAVEAGALGTADTQALLQACLDPLLEEGIDQLVLGCTHYPFLQPMIRAIIGPEIEIINPAPAVARQVGRVMAQHNLLDRGKNRGYSVFYTTGDPATFAKLVKQLISQQGEIRTLTWQAGRLVKSFPGKQTGA